VDQLRQSRPGFVWIPSIRRFHQGTVQELRYIEKTTDPIAMIQKIHASSKSQP
jgi:hypothetical protein